MKTLDPCAWRYVLTQDDIASFRLKARSDVVGAWEIESTTYNYFYCQVKVVVSARCFTSTISKTGKTHFSQQMEKEDSVATKHTRVLLLPPALTRLTQPAINLLKRDNTPPTGASKAYRESQSRIFKTEAPLFVGAGEGTDNLDFLADLSALKVIDPDEVTHAVPPGMRSTAALLSMPNKYGIILGGRTIRGFNENTMQGYPLKLSLTTRQVTDVVMYDENILCAKDGRQVPDDTSVIPDPIKENYPACTMPLSSTSPVHVTPEIMRNRQYAEEYIAHVLLIRELLDQASLSTNSALLALSNNRLYRSLSGLLKGASDWRS